MSRGPVFSSARLDPSLELLKKKTMVLSVVEAGARLKILELRHVLEEAP